MRIILVDDMAEVCGERDEWLGSEISRSETKESGIAGDTAKGSQ
jgi:hypothetical protein